MNKSFQFRLLCAGVALLGLLVSAGCHYPDYPSDDLGEQIMKRHYQNGEMTSDEYKQQVKEFNPQAQVPEQQTINDPSKQVQDAAHLPQVTLDFQTGFNGTHIHVMAAGKEVFTGVISTNPYVGLAKTVTFDAPENTTKLQIEIDGTVQTFDLDLSQGKYIAAHRYPTGQITLEQSKTPFSYKAD